MSDTTIIFIDTSISADSILIVADNLREIGGDALDIDITTQPVWTNITDPSISGYTISARIDGLGIAGWKNLPLAQVETRVSKDVRPPDKQKIKVLSEADFRLQYQPPVSPV